MNDSQPIIVTLKESGLGPHPVLPTHVQKHLAHFAQPLCTWIVIDGTMVGDAHWPQSGWRSSGCTRHVFTAARGEEMHGQRPVTTCSGPRVHRRAAAMGNKWTRAGMRGGTGLLAPLSWHRLDLLFIYFFKLLWFCWTFKAKLTRLQNWIYTKPPNNTIFVPITMTLGEWAATETEILGEPHFLHRCFGLHTVSWRKASTISK